MIGFRCECLTGYQLIDDQPTLPDECVLLSSSSRFTKDAMTRTVWVDVDVIKWYCQVATKWSSASGASDG